MNATKPNIIVFMTDQQNAQTMYDSHPAITPNISRFLKKSTQFTQAFCPSPHCCPSRATFFSGLYPSQHGVWNNVEVDNALSRGLFDNVTLFPEELFEAGYETVFSGKWHVSAYETPSQRGFSNVVNHVVSNFGTLANDNLPKRNEWDNTYIHTRQFDTDEEKEREADPLGGKEFGRIIRPGYPTYYQFGVHENPFNDTYTVDCACDAIRKHDQEKPLFMYVGTTGPHDPYTPPQRFLDMYNIEDIVLPVSFEDDMKDRPALYRRTRDQFALSIEEHKESIRRYLAYVSYEDDLFGKLLDSIEENGLADNTIIMYLTDHGDYAGAHGLWAKGLPCFQEAYNICAAVSGPNIQEDVKVDQLVSLADFAPTILEIAGIQSKQTMVGKSLTKLLYQVDDLDSEWRTEIYTQTNGNEIYGIQRAVWNRKWKYVYNSFDYDELYNLEEDPHEMNNLMELGLHREIVKELCEKLWHFAELTGDTCTCPYIMVGLAPYGPGINITNK